MRLAVAQRRETLRCLATIRSRVASRSQPCLESAPLFPFAYDSTGVDVSSSIELDWLRAG